MGNTDVVLGMKWLHAIGEFTLNLRDMEMKFKVDGTIHILKAIKDNNLKVITLKRMERLIKHDMVERAAECKLMLSYEDQHTTPYHSDVPELRVKHTKVFNGIPPGKPPDRGIEHIIEPEEGTKPIMNTPYRHPKRLKDEIEKTIKELLALG